jgi:hypothetical protein
MIMIPSGAYGGQTLTVVASQLFSITLQGITLSMLNRILITQLASNTLCETQNNNMTPYLVLGATALGSSATVSADLSSETWANLQINTAGVYTVCWCDGSTTCSASTYKSTVMTLTVTGILLLCFHSWIYALFQQFCSCITSL